MSALSAVLLTYTFNLCLLFFHIRSARRHSSVVGLRSNDSSMGCLVSTQYSHLVHYNSVLFVDFYTYCTSRTGMNTSQKSYKKYDFTLTAPSIVVTLSAVRNYCGRPLFAVRSIRLVARKFRRKSSNVHLCNFC